MHALFGLLFGYLARIFFGYLIIKALVFTVLAGITIAFTAEMVDLAQSLVVPTLPPKFLEGLKLLPASTSTYITIMISAIISKWLFISAGKGLSVFR